MLGSLKKLFFKDTGEDLATSIPEPAPSAPVREWPKIPAKPAATAPVAPSPKPAAPPPAQSSSVELVSLPLQSILSRLPNSLAAVVQSQGNGFVSLPAKRIVQELPKGSVKIPFGEIRQAAPPGTFFDNARLDQVLVELPLAEILARLHPSLLSRRPGQKQMQLPSDITDIFGPHGEGVSLGASQVGAVRTSGVKTSGTTSFAKKSDTSLAKKGDTSFARTGDTAISMRNDTSFRTRTMPPVTPGNIFSSPTAVVPPPSSQETAPVEVGEPVVVPLALICENWPELVCVEIREAKLSNMPVSIPLDKLGEALHAGKIIFTWRQICAWMQPPVEIVSGAQDIPVELPLNILTPLFLARHRPTKAQKKISVPEIPDLFAMKPGSATAPAQPSPAPTAAAVPDTKPAPAPAAAPAASIPFVLPTTPAAKPVATPKVAPAAAPAKPVVPPVTPIAPAAPVQDAPAVALPKLSMAPSNITELPKKPVEAKPEPAPTPKPVAAKPSTIGEIFNQPARNDWPPAEVLKLLVALPEIEGAFLAMQDGLLVSAELPSQFKAETVAAFLPQIFGRMNQYTKELQLGGLSSLTFVVNNVAWQIFKSGGIYLVALSKPGKNLPGEKLNIIAAELGKQMQ